MFEVYQSDEDQQFYWRLKADNGQIIATGGEGYSSRAAALRAIGTVQGTVTRIAAERAEAQADAQAKVEEADAA